MKEYHESPWHRCVECGRIYSKQDASGLPFALVRHLLIALCTGCGGGQVVQMFFPADVSKGDVVMRVGGLANCLSVFEERPE